MCIRDSLHCEALLPIDDPHREWQFAILWLTATHGADDGFLPLENGSAGPYGLLEAARACEPIRLPQPVGFFPRSRLHRIASGWLWHNPSALAQPNPKLPRHR